MFRLNTFDDPFLTDPFKLMDAIFNYDSTALSCRGLKPIISRPHNLINIKNEQGEIIGTKIEVCTTPFKTEDVKVEISNNMLTVLCGTENRSVEENEELVYHGISSQSYSFSLKLSDRIDKSAITAKNINGILTITMPFKPKTNTVDSISIKVQEW